LTLTTPKIKGKKRAYEALIPLVKPSTIE